jgi:hypothetical protein
MEMLHSRFVELNYCMVHKNWNSCVNCVNWCRFSVLFFATFLSLCTYVFWNKFSEYYCSSICHLLVEILFTKLLCFRTLSLKGVWKLGTVSYTKVECKDMKWIQLALDKGQWKTCECVNSIMASNFLTS